MTERLPTIMMGPWKQITIGDEILVRAGSLLCRALACLLYGNEIANSSLWCWLNR